MVCGPFFLDIVVWHIHHHVGMAGKDELANAVLGGASDYMTDIAAKIIQWYQAKDEDKVVCLYTCRTC